MGPAPLKQALGLLKLCHAQRQCNCPLIRHLVVVEQQGEVATMMAHGLMPLLTLGE